MLHEGGHGEDEMPEQRIDVVSSLRSLEPGENPQNIEKNIPQWLKGNKGTSRLMALSALRDGEGRLPDPSGADERLVCDRVGLGTPGV